MARITFTPPEEKIPSIKAIRDSCSSLDLDGPGLFEAKRSVEAGKVEVQDHQLAQVIVDALTPHVENLRVDYMKVITLSFNVPDDVETTSENLALMKQLLLSALEDAVSVESRNIFVKTNRALADAMLIES